MQKKRYYCDYNASTPLAPSVYEWLVKGDFPYANPSAMHSSGQAVRRRIQKIRNFFLEQWNLEKSHKLFFHSGATEGINTIIQGLANLCINKSIPFFYFYSKTDHPVSKNLATMLSSKGHQCHEIPLLNNGDIDIDQLLVKIEKNVPVQARNKQQLCINFLHANNETGVVWPLEWACLLEEKTNAHIHVDCVQSIGRTQNIDHLPRNISSFTFSGHKFGAFKGVGFSLMEKTTELTPLLIGGGQENNLRSGTENILGIISLELAYNYYLKNYDYKKNIKSKEYFENKIKELLGDKICIVGENATLRNSNTSLILFFDKKKDVLLARLDMAGIEISGGSSCSSGMLEASSTLIAMGHSNEQAHGAMRFSFDPFWDEKNMNEFWAVIKGKLHEMV